MKQLLFVFIGFVFGTFVTFCTIRFVVQLPPTTPTLKQPESLTVFLHPWSGYEAASREAVHVPTEKQEQIVKRLAPETYFGHINERICPLVADVYIEHADQTETHVFVRDYGHNPALISIDGENYFYARNEPDVYAGANELINLVAEIAYKQQIQQASE